MAHDVFISYATPDKTVADAVCAKLENQGIRCWIAPRNVTPGLDWSAEIIEAISKSKIMVLIYSAHSNVSPQIKREVERAVHKGVIIVPFRIQDVPMSKALEYFISSPHWMDALTPPLEKHLNYLTETVQLLLSRNAPEAEMSKGKKQASQENDLKTELSAVLSRYFTGRRRLLLGITFLALIAIAYSLWNRSGDFDSRWTGLWQAAVPFNNGVNTTTLSIEKNGEYQTAFVYKENGTATIRPERSGGTLLLVPSKGIPTNNSYMIVNPNTITITGPAGTANWTRSSKSSGLPPFGEWSCSSEVNGLPTKLQLIIYQNHNYELHSTSRDQGILETDRDIWKMTSHVSGNITTGRYTFLDQTQVSMSGPLGTAVWTRQ